MKILGRSSSKPVDFLTPFVIVAAVVVLVFPCAASQQGPLNPTSATNSSAGCTCVNWTNVAYIENGSLTGAYISVLGGSGGSTTSNFAVGSAFGFSIPDDATITGISFTVGTLTNATATDGVYAQTEQVGLIKAGTPTGTIKGPGSHYLNGPAFHDENWGGSSDLWGGTWTPSDINNAGFGVELQGLVDSSSCVSRCNPTFYARINNFRLTVTYSVPLAGINYFYTVGSDGTLVGPCFAGPCSSSEPWNFNNFAPEFLQQSQHIQGS